MKRALFTGALAVVAAAALLVSVNPTQSTAAEAATYVGSDACKACHFKQHRYWKKTGMAKAMDSLKPTTEADDKELFDRKKASNVDPAKDYTTDASCLACHTTGYGKTGGYPTDAAANAEAAGKQDHVGCEACHGAGSEYIKFKEAKLAADDKAKFTFDELAPSGLAKPDEANCKTCHNDKNPTNASDDFKFKVEKDLVHSKKKK